MCHFGMTEWARVKGFSTTSRHDTLGVNVQKCLPEVSALGKSRKKIAKITYLGGTAIFGGYCLFFPIGRIIAEMAVTSSDNSVDRKKIGLGNPCGNECKYVP